MKDEAVTDTLLRQFLLGAVEDEERQRIESLFLTDPQTRERLLDAELELLDDYVDDCLSAVDRERFLSIYGHTNAQRRKLRIAKSIQKWSESKPDQASTAPPQTMSLWASLFNWLRLKRTIVIPITVSVAVGIIIAIVWITGLRSERLRRHNVIEQELAELNSPSRLREVIPGAPSLTLKPGSSRSIEPQPELATRRDSPVVELSLLWMQEEDYPTYKAVVIRDDTDESFTILNLPSENKEGKIIRLRLPTHLLARGRYEIRVSGNLTANPTEVYSFTVSE
jgi:hypothetical protein